MDILATKPGESVPQMKKKSSVTRVLVVCDAAFAVPPLTYGGTERAAHVLCKGLAARGLRVDLIAGRGSRKYGGKLFLHQPASSSRLSRFYRKVKFQFLLLQAARNADVVICFGRTDYLRALYATKVPIIVRYANPVDQSMVDSVSDFRRDHIKLVGVGHEQMSGIHTELPVHILHNGVDLKKYTFSSKPDSPPYLAFLGRLTKNKGPDIAIKAAKRAGLPLRIAGNVPDSERGDVEYFHTEIEPHLDSKVEWIGPVDDDQKVNLLRGATALLFPIQGRDAFANVLPESLACGCPVIGWKNGCVPEAITDGSTGYIVESLSACVDAIHRIDQIDRQSCRDAAEQRFDAENVVERYIELIEDFVGKVRPV